MAAGDAHYYIGDEEPVDLAAAGWFITFVEEMINLAAQNENSNISRTFNVLEKHSGTLAYKTFNIGFKWNVIGQGIADTLDITVNGHRHTVSVGGAGR